MKIKSAEAENIKGIKHVKVQMDGKSLIISGGNGNDKSTFIQILKSACNPKFLPDVVITDGQEKGEFKVVLSGDVDGEPQEYTIIYKFTTANQKGSITVKELSGKIIDKSPKSVIASIVGDISFDVFKFINEPKSKQIETLKKLTGKVVELDELEVKKKGLLSSKLDNENKIKAFSEIIKHDYTNEQIELYSTPINDIGKKADLETVSTDLDNWNKAHAKIKECVAGEITSQEAIESANQKIERLKAEIIDYQESIELAKKRKEDFISSKEKVDKWLVGKKEPSITTINAELDVIRDHNKHCEKVKEIAGNHKKLLTMKEGIEKFASDIKENERKRDAVIASSEIPVQGLSFTTDDVLYNGLPFNDLQINKAEIIKVGMMIGRALNPNLSVAFIGDGSLLDKANTELVFDIANELDLQLIIERVNYDGGPLKIDFVEVK